MLLSSENKSFGLKLEFFEQFAKQLAAVFFPKESVKI
jgi:hypothetical protein